MRNSHEDTKTRKVQEKAIIGQSLKTTSGLLGEILLLFLAAILAYAPSLNNGFVYDDETFVLNNPLVQGNPNVHSIFTESYPTGKTDQALYRPLVTLSYFLDYKTWGFAKPGHWNGFHLTNLLLHGLNAVLLSLLLRRLGLGYWQRLLACLVFIFQPALCEAVAWVVGRAELMATTFGLLAILALLRRPGGIGLIASLILWFCAILCKEHWIVLPGLVALLWICQPSILKIDRRSTLQAGFGVVLVAAFFLLIRWQILGAWRPSIVAYDNLVSPFSRVATSLGLLWKYVGTWLWPVSLSVHHDVSPITHPGHGIALVATWLAAFWAAWRTHKYFSWLPLALGWFFLGMILVSNLIISVATIFAERFLYMPTLFFAPLMILMVSGALSTAFKSSIRKPLNAILGLTWCLFLLVSLWTRLNDWRSNVTLWESASRIYPQSAVIKATLAESLLREADFSRAHQLAAEALQVFEKAPVAYQRLMIPHLLQINALAQQGMQKKTWLKQFGEANELARSLKPMEALAAYQRIIRDFPEEPLTYEAIGDLYTRMNNPVAACQNFQKAIQFGTETSVIFAKYGQTLSELGKKAEAVMAYDRSLKINPSDHITHYNRGVVLGELGDYKGALASFAEANHLFPNFAAPHLNAGAILIHLKQYDQARQEIMQVLAVDPRQRDAIDLLQKIPEPARK